jgi:hypothetical protein
MKIATRDALAALLVEAFDERTAADALRCLVSYCCRAKEVPLILPVDQFLLPATAAERKRVSVRLRESELLVWDSHSGAESVSWRTTLAAEYVEITEKLTQYSAVMNEWFPDETAPALRTALRKGALLFNHHLFFEVHEVLEAQWRKESSDVRPFLQGLIQIAVAFYHLGNGNFRGTISLLQDGLVKLRPHQPAFLGIQLDDFIAALEACHKELRQLGPEGFSSFRSQMIPQMQFMP